MFPLLYIYSTTGIQGCSEYLGLKKSLLILLTILHTMWSLILLLIFSPNG
jgi:hypothetical protein